LNSLVGAGEWRGWHGGRKRLGGIHIDYRLVLGRSLYWKVGRLFCPEYAINVACGASVLINHIDPVGDQATGGRKVRGRVDGGKPMLSRQRNDQIVMNLCR